MPVLSLSKIAMGFGERTLFENVSFEVESRDKVGLIGRNGVGKTTLFKIICGELEPTAGVVATERGLNVGYMEQHACSAGDRSVYDELESVFDELKRMEHEIEKITVTIDRSTGDLTDLIARQTELIERFERDGGLTYKSRTRSALTGLGFRAEEFDMPTSALSGGQRSKLSLLKLLLSGSDLLLLDEPTNHLDIESREVFEDALLDFPGTALIVSHDRYFLNKVPTRICELTADGLVTFLGKYDYYQEKRDELVSARKYMKELAAQGQESVQTEHSALEAGSKEERFLKKQQEAEERRKRREKEALEKEIGELEARIAAREQEMCTEEVLADLARLRELDEAVKADRERLDLVYEKWLQYE